MSQFVSCGVPSTTLLFKMLSSHSSRVSFPFSTVFFVVTVFPLTTFVDVEVDLKFPPPPNPPPPKLWKNEELFDPKGSLPNPLPNPKLEPKPKLGKLPKGSLGLNLLWLLFLFLPGLSKEIANKWLWIYENHICELPVHHLNPKRDTWVTSSCSEDPNKKQGYFCLVSTMSMMFLLYLDNNRLKVDTLRQKILSDK